MICYTSTRDAGNGTEAEQREGAPKQQAGAASPDASRGGQAETPLTGH